MAAFVSLCKDALKINRVSGTPDIRIYAPAGALYISVIRKARICATSDLQQLIENIFYMFDVELVKRLLYLRGRPLFLVYPDIFLAVCKHFCRGFLKGRIGYESCIMDLIFKNSRRLSRKWIVFCNNIFCCVLCICMAVFSHISSKNM